MGFGDREFMRAGAKIPATTPSARCSKEGASICMADEHARLQAHPLRRSLLAHHGSTPWRSGSCSMFRQTRQASFLTRRVRER